MQKKDESDRITAFYNGFFCIREKTRLSKMTNAPSRRHDMKTNMVVYYNMLPGKISNMTSLKTSLQYMVHFAICRVKIFRLMVDFAVCSVKFSRWKSHLSLWMYQSYATYWDLSFCREI